MRNNNPVQKLIEVRSDLQRLLVRLDEAITEASTASPIDRLITAMANIVEDDARSVRIKHLFVRRTDTDLQISLDMHEPNA